MGLSENEFTSEAGTTLAGRLLTIAAFVAVAASLTSCSSENGERTARDRTASANQAVSPANGQPSPANEPQPSGNGPGTGLPANQQRPEPASPIEMARNKRSQAMRENVDTKLPDVETLLRQSAKPAPESSEFSVALTDILVERRTFLKHPILARAEKVTRGPDKTIYVFVRDGRQFTLPGNAIDQLSIATSTDILKAVKIETPQATPAENKPRVRSNN